MFDRIEKWANMPEQTKLNFLIGAIIVSMGFMIYTLDGKVGQVKEEKAAEKMEFAIKSASDQARLDVCKDQYLRYLEKSEREYRELLFQSKQLKNRNHESN